MTIVLSILVILTALFMIVTVLLQSSKSAGLGTIAGQVTSNMSKTKAATVESKLQLGTKISAIAFVVLSLILWIIG
ncbi:MAG: preprotein translocase subunit SecG [Clostridia bacterium]|nr:preprotein translocase subunit SecG [Clostridia bacterium]